MREKTFLKVKHKIPVLELNDVNKNDVLNCNASEYLLNGMY